MSDPEKEIETYGDPRIATYDHAVPWSLILTYIFVPLWGFAIFYLYINGSSGWLDRGFWGQLQSAANTTFPIMNLNEPP